MRRAGLSASAELLVLFTATVCMELREICNHCSITGTDFISHQRWPISQFAQSSRIRFFVFFRHFSIKMERKHIIEIGHFSLHSGLFKRTMSRTYSHQFSSSRDSSLHERYLRLLYSSTVFYQDP